MRKTVAPSSRDEDFANWLVELATKDLRGELAALRRGLMYEEDQLFQLFSHIPPRFLHQLNYRQDEQDHLLVAALFAYHPACYSREQLQQDRCNMGDSLRQLAKAKQSEANSTESELLSEPLKRRFEAMIACPRGELHEHLRQCISLLKSDSIPVDWAQLLCDLHAWNWSRHPVQWDWSRAFFVGDKEMEGEE